jgi:hypothetical protein
MVLLERMDRLTRPGRGVTHVPRCRFMVTRGAPRVRMRPRIPPTTGSDRPMRTATSADDEIEVECSITRA